MHENVIPFIAEEYYAGVVDHGLFIHSPVDGLLGCLQIVIMYIFV